MEPLKFSPNLVGRLWAELQLNSQYGKEVQDLTITLPIHRSYILNQIKESIEQNIKKEVSR